MGYIVDISKWNDNINWTVAAKNLDLAICRVQYGSLKRDKLYNQHVQKLEAYGVPHAAYAYGCYVSVNDAIVEAKDFMARVSPNARFLVLDVEDDTLASCGPSKLAAASQAFIDTCKAAGWKVGLYVSHHMYEKYGLSNVKADFYGFHAMAISRNIVVIYGNTQTIQQVGMYLELGIVMLTV